MEFRVLGPLELWSGGRRVEISGVRQLSVLGMLLVEPGRPVSQDQLIDAVWGEAVPASAEATLHSCVYRIRKALDKAGGAALRRGAFGYMLDVLDVPGDAVDFVDGWRFERLATAGRRALDECDHEEAAARLREALGLWRGEAFEGIEAPAVRERAAGLADLRLDATEWCLTAELALGRHEVLVGELETLAGEYPYRERFWELLMLALYRSGRQAEALEAYQRMYRRLDDDLGVRPGPAVRALQQQILAGAPELQASPTAARARPEAVVPRLLPAGVRDFTGRVEHLKALDALLPASVDDEAMVIAVVAGTAGVGKTALAVHWAHQVVDRFPDGQLYVNLRGFGPSGHAMPAGEAIRRFLDALGVPAERIPVDLEAQAGMYRSLLAGQRMLVLLDNAADEEQVRPLLPASPGCLVLVTSRNQLPGLIAAEAAHPVNLVLLTDAEAHELLSRRLGHDRIAAEPDATRELIQCCARLPLALAVVAGRAAMNPTFSLEAIAAQLRDTDNSLDAFTGSDAATDLRAVFSWSVTQLTAQAARLFRLLGLDPGTEIGKPAAASLAGVTVERVRALLAELCRAYLLTEQRPGRYAVHDLLRLYAQELVTGQESEAEQTSASKRVLDHYLHSAYAAAVMIDPHRNRIQLVEPDRGARPEQFAAAEEAKAWMQVELTTLVDAVDAASSRGLHTHAWQLALTLNDVLNRSGRWRDQIACHLIGLRSAQLVGNLAPQAQMHRLTADAYSRMGQFDDARRHLEQALAVELDDPVEHGRTRLHFSALLCRQGCYRPALEHAQQALELFRGNDTPVNEAATLNQVGWLLAELGEYDRALDNCEQSLVLMREFGIEFSQGHALDSIGYIHHRRGDFRKAVEYYLKAAAKIRQRGDRYPEAMVLLHLGDSMLAAGDRAAAHNSWREALTILDELGHPDAEQVRAKLAG